MKAISVAELKQLTQDNGGIVLLDVRRRAVAEADPVTLPGPVWRDPERVEEWRRGLDPQEAGGIVLREAAGGGVRCR